MADDWKDKGTVPTAGGTFGTMLLPILDHGDHHIVENTKTGETMEVDRHAYQSVGEAIANGQFVDKK